MDGLLRPEGFKLEAFDCISCQFDPHWDATHCLELESLREMHNGDYLNVLQRYENRMNSTEARLQSLESALENLTRSYSSASRKN